MFIIRYRTHQPWQTETFPDKGVSRSEPGYHPAYVRAEELSRSYREVRLERVSDMIEFKDGVRGFWHDD